MNPADAIISSPLLGDFGGGFGGGMDMGGEAGDAAGAASGGGMFADYGGVDPSLDPELAMALRASAEEARAHEAARAAAAASDSAAAAPTDGAAAPADAMDEEDEDALLQAALAISMQGTQPPAASTPVAAPAPEPVATPAAVRNMSGLLI